MHCVGDSTNEWEIIPVFRQHTPVQTVQKQTLCVFTTPLASLEVWQNRFVAPFANAFAIWTKQDRFVLGTYQFQSCRFDARLQKRCELMSCDIKDLLTLRLGPWLP
jgi:hypothetical protein